ncbi:nucleotidyl transferase AbiEii/AbiGii toxin family protein [Cyclobacterium plantarum]|uniref:nucleotidyl transferase AbiEii/AbiGii toxin family protein n=1 Tax=Cyclobacterium plantarum TaxID=2716263 RepID=UPI003F6F3932
MEYRMNLHQDHNLFRQAVRFTSDQRGIPAIYIEKDYWVTYALFLIFRSELKDEVVFKGGTSLSKCHKLIDRFSEDIDLVVLRKDGETDSRLKAKLKSISNIITKNLPEIRVEGITRKKGMNRKTAHTYNKEFAGDYGQVRDVIILESTWLGYFEPYSKKMLNSLVGEMMLNSGQKSIAELHGLLPFEASVLDPTRTICEKIMSLVRFSYGENPVEDLKKKIRHTYDLHQLLRQEELSEFFHSSSFDEMLKKVANDDVISFKNNNHWLVHHPCEALIFNRLAEIWEEIKEDYNVGFKNLVYGDFPKDSDVLQTLKMIHKRLETIVWSIKREDTDQD